MKAIICEKYSTPDVLQIRDVIKPIPKDNEILIKVHASTASTADSMMRTGTPFFGRLFIDLMKPKHTIPDTGFAGVIESTGNNVTLRGRA